MWWYERTVHRRLKSLEGIDVDVDFSSDWVCMPRLGTMHDVAIDDFIRIKLK